MKIKELHSPQRQGGRVRIVFEDGSTLAVPPAAAVDFCLLPGQEFSEAELAELRRAAGEASAKSRAVRIISATGVTRRDLEQRLIQKGESAEDAKTAVAWLDELALLDDAETARQIVARGVSRGYGERRIRQMLFEKRVPREYWEEALKGIPPMDGELDRFLAGRLHGSTERRDVDRAVQAALRRGHEWSAIRAALQRYNQSIEIEEDN